MPLPQEIYSDELHQRFMGGNFEALSPERIMESSHPIAYTVEQLEIRYIKMQKLLGEIIAT